MYIQINELEKDLLREIMNVGVSKAADAFALLTNSKSAIILTVPEVKIIKPEEFPDELSAYQNIEMAIKTQLKGDLEGITLLLFLDQQLNWIVRNTLSEKDQAREDIRSLQQSLLLEMSNILTGAILTQLANILELKVVGLPPENIIPEEGQSFEEILCDVPPCQPIVLSVHTDFMDREKMIEFPLLLVLEIASLSKILNVIRQKGIYDYQLLKKP